MRLVGIVVAVAALGAACPGPEPTKPATLSSIHDDIFHIGCSASVCHGGPGPADGMNLDLHPFEDLVNVDSVDNPGEKRVIPGDPDHSVLYLALQGVHGNTQRMPLTGDPLPPEDIERIRQWIADGAKNN